MKSTGSNTEERCATAEVVISSFMTFLCLPSFPSVKMYKNVDTYPADNLFPTQSCGHGSEEGL